jgi:hypothetical protein
MSLPEWLDSEFPDLSPELRKSVLDYWGTEIPAVNGNLRFCYSCGGLVRSRTALIKGTAVTVNENGTPHECSMDMRVSGSLELSAQQIINENVNKCMK